MPHNQRLSRAQNSIEESLRRLQVDYIDLFIIHWPGLYAVKANDPLNAKLRAESWTAMEHMYRMGKLRAIGVSNYEIRHLEQLLSTATVQPALNQCEYHPHFDQRELIDYCKRHNIIFQAYSSFGSPRFMHKLLEDETIKEVASEYNCSVTQFLLAWAISQGVSVLPRSGNPEHIIENFKSIEYRISAEDIEKVRAKKQHKYCWDPATVL
uniref:NADP-dependent oxidoreductase domain-containing protein n=1 Tax=Parascaris univalens TaxID=6257 RepID=A0A915B7K9_PARUN